MDLGHPETALTLLEAVELDRAPNHRVGMAYSLLSHGAALASVGREGEARDEIGTSLGIFGELGDAEGVADGLDELAMVIGGTRPEAAARLFLAAEALRERGDVRLRDVDQRRLGPAVAAVLSRVDEATVARLRHEAAVVDVDAAIALARSAAEGPAPGAS